jgi:predicted Fe-Mo cluster-binding NifX family protein
MKICIPTNNDGGLEDSVCEHFGRAPTYTVVDTDTGHVRVIRNSSEHMGGAGKPPEQIAATGADVLVCSGLGPRAIDMLCSYGIAVYIGATGTVKQAVESYKRGSLTPASKEAACKEHRH